MNVYMLARVTDRQPGVVYYNYELIYSWAFFLDLCMSAYLIILITVCQLAVVISIRNSFLI